jgi:hypothetical protein
MDSLNVTPDVASMQYNIQPAAEQYQGSFFSHTKCPPEQDSISSCHDYFLFLALDPKALMPYH